jgi:predicted transcriptional regulator
VHLQAAVEVWSYCEDSVRHLFGDALGDETADTIRQLLRRTEGGMTQTEISNAFGRNRPAAELHRALKVLAHKGLARAEREETEGGPAMRWFSNEDGSTKRTNSTKRWG